MSDAMGDEKNPTSGEPIEPVEAKIDEAAPAETAEGAGRASEEPRGVSDAPDEGALGTDAVGEETPAEPVQANEDAVDEGGASVDAAMPVKDAAPDDAYARAEESAAGDAPGAVGPTDADAASSGEPEAAAARPEPAADTAVYELDDEAPVEPPSDPASAADSGPITDPETSSGPDYAALAAELEEFEARQAGATGTAPQAAPTTAGAGWFEEDPDTFKATEPDEAAHGSDDAPTEAVEPVSPAVTTVLPSEPASTSDGDEPERSAAIFETYEPPRKRGNRVAALLIGLPATIVFAILYALVDLVWGWYQGEVSLATVFTDLLARIAEPAYWVPIVTFFIAFWLVGVIVNRGRAGWWVVLGLLVAAVTYAGFVLAPVLTYPFWMMTPNDAQITIGELLLNPVAIASFVLAREVTVWFGAWVAGRGRKMKRLNAEDKVEYDNAVAAGE